ncbi:hypothetical protein B0T19DRAFT_438311 [Cercophora scortea]|uniref:Uncharacterized protein n=1 Tax=Cercophora scortea TaxID=314031 RepID=A0AAE0J6A8_9PEZI|nr:hypothetical protein B0T19DRAFT_438311 [Cercophora scortea]
MAPTDQGDMDSTNHLALLNCPENTGTEIEATAPPDAKHLPKTFGLPDREPPQHAHGLSPWWTWSRLCSPVLQTLALVWGNIYAVNLIVSTFLSTTESLWSGLTQLGKFSLMGVGVWVNPGTAVIAVATAGVVSGVCSMQAMPTAGEPLCTWMNSLTGWGTNYEKAFVCDKPPRMHLRDPVVVNLAVSSAFRHALSLYPNSTGEFDTMADKERFLGSVKEYEDMIKAHSNNITRTQDTLKNIICIIQKYPTTAPSNYSCLSQLGLSMHMAANPHVVAVANRAKELARYADEQFALRRKLIAELRRKSGLKGGDEESKNGSMLAKMIKEACGLENRAIQWRDSVLKEVQDIKDQIRKAKSPHEPTARCRKAPDNCKEMEDSALKIGISLQKLEVQLKEAKGQAKKATDCAASAGMACRGAKNASHETMRLSQKASEEIPVLYHLVRDAKEIAKKIKTRLYAMPSESEFVRWEEDLQLVIGYYFEHVKKIYWEDERKGK